MSLGDYLRDSSVWHRRAADAIDQVGYISITQAVLYDAGSSSYYVPPSSNPLEPYLSAIGDRLVNGMIVTFVPFTTNTGAANFYFGPVAFVAAAFPIVRNSNLASTLYAGEIVANLPVSLRLLNVNGPWQLLTSAAIAQSYTPTYSAGGSMTFTSVTTSSARYTIRQNLVRLYLDFTGTTGGTASTSIIATLPITASSNIRVPAIMEDPGRVAGVCNISGTTATFSRLDGAVFGLGAGRSGYVCLEYEI